MNTRLRELPIKKRIKIVEDLWDSIAIDQKALALTSEQKSELDRRLNAYKTDRNQGSPVAEAVTHIRRRL